MKVYKQSLLDDESILVVEIVLVYMLMTVRYIVMPGRTTPPDCVKHFMFWEKSNDPVFFHK